MSNWYLPRKYLKCMKKLFYTLHVVSKGWWYYHVKIIHYHDVESCQSLGRLYTCVEKFFVVIFKPPQSHNLKLLLSSYFKIGSDILTNNFIQKQFYIEFKAILYAWSKYDKWYHAKLDIIYFYNKTTHTNYNGV